MKPRPSRLRAALTAALVAAAGCRDATRRTGPRRPTRRDAARDGDTPRRPRGRAELPLPSPPEGAPSLAATGGGLVAAWAEGGAVRAWRHDGARWIPLGDRLNERPSAGPVRVARAPDGGVAAAWVEAGPGAPPEVRLAQWDGQRWRRRLGMMNTPTPGGALTSLALSWAGESPVVVTTASRQPGGARTELRAAWWTGARWDIAGPPSLLAPGAAAQAVGAASCDDGASLLAWVEVGAQGTPTLALRRWNAQQRNWTELPRGNAPTVDAGTGTLSLVCMSTGEAALAYGWSAGTHAVHRWSDEAGDWVAQGLPRDGLRAVALEWGPSLAAQGDALWMTWRAPGGRMSAAVHRGGAWRVVSEALSEPGATVGEAAVDRDGVMYVSARGPAGGWRVTRFAPE